MAKIIREKHKLFGLAGSSTNFAKFGSLVAAAPIKSKDIATIQSLSAWDNGFQDSIFGANKDLLLEDLNAWCYEHSYQLANILQDGVSAWEVGTTYYIGSIVRRDGTFELYGSLVNNNTGNALPAQADNGNWKYLSKTTILDGGVSVGAIPKASAAAPGVLVNSAISEDASFVITSKAIKFPDTTTQATAASPITVQNVVTGSRAIGTVFQNLSGKVMFVTVTLGQAGDGGDGTARALTDANPAPTTIVVADGSASTPTVTPFSLNFIVLPGRYYKVVNVIGTYSLFCWVESF